MRPSTVLFLLLAGRTSAYALDQSVHRKISHDGCVGAGLPQDFCERVGTEAYNVDSYEWNRPEAHAQIGDTDTACTAANAALERERALGSDLRTSLDQLATRNSETLRIHIATQLGRALHTIQDDCAHHGMPNAQHAWASRTDACTGSKTSPDLAPEAEVCAREETAHVFGAFTAEMHEAGVDAAALDDLGEGWAHWPARGDVCNFLRDAETWDGIDRGWDNSVVVPWLRDQLTSAITTDDGSLGDACAAGVHLTVREHAAVVDTSTPPDWCFKLEVYCIGKADGPDEAPPWEDDSAAADAPSGGCSVGSPAPAWLLVALVGFGLVVRRGRR